MALKDDLVAEVNKIFVSRWDVRNGLVVPETVGLGNVGVEVEGTVLYADLDGSTDLVDTNTATFAAEIYKSYLYCAAKIIRAEGGTITAYDGDRIMAVFIGESKNTNAVRTGLKINYAVENIVNPGLKKVYTSSQYVVKQVVGIDTCKLLVSGTGIRGSNDLVWVGRAANHAAKMAALTPVYPTRISKEVYDNMNDEVKFSGSNNMWISETWKGRTIYKSAYWWSL
ncbi:adenylate/guanylate cyclase domain-containing protein [Hymenobacter weizhouensis]|uniref:adenylate/guanylate cyclase domain-containing protein n=1 Tax=Hymenobacter sp. YIM 151500-1 TaxID=2987689 RepID=UPI002227FF83|nr:hypothetical protein [Hymenobacter sp. YIM 151500-1]UYZ64893.1 hypothetical protein OIS53_08585 [Hymenobacter sp. YIM 151500-1]